ncbi:MAG: hypothetical protein ACOH1P_09355 [Lysobacter sp.]
MEKKIPIVTPRLSGTDEVDRHHVSMALFGMGLRDFTHPTYSSLEIDMHILNKTAILVCVVALVACGRTEPTAVTTAASPAIATSAGDAPTPAPTTGIWFDPAALSACGTGKDVVTVHWDVTSYSDVAAVQIKILENGGADGLFAATGPQGSKDSGPWMHAGSTMAVQNAADGTELARSSVGSIPCP